MPSARRAGRGSAAAVGRAVSPACHGSLGIPVACAQARIMHAGKCHMRAVWRAPRASPGMQQQAAGSAAVIHGTGGWLEDLPAGAQRAARTASRLPRRAACGAVSHEPVVSRRAFRPESAGTPSLRRTGASAPPLSAVLRHRGDILQSVAEVSADKAARGVESSQTLRGAPCCAVHTAPGATPFVLPLVRAPAAPSTCSHRDVWAFGCRLAHGRDGRADMTQCQCGRVDARGHTRTTRPALLPSPLRF